MTQKPVKKVAFGPCCFCGQPIDKTEIDPCSVTVETSGGNWQVWFSHAACFKKLLCRDWDFEPQHF
jgi:hypothetical protein